MNLRDTTRDLIGQVEQQTGLMVEGVTTVDDPLMDEVVVIELCMTPGRAGPVLLNDGPSVMMTGSAHRVVCLTTARHTNLLLG